MQLLTIWGLHNHTSFFDRDVLLPKGRGPHHCEGEIIKEPQAFPEKIYLVVALSQCAAGPGGVWQKAKGNVRLRLEQSSPGAWHQGEIIRFRASFRPPSEFKSPGAFKAKRYYLSQKIDALGFIADPRWVVVLGGPATGPAWMQIIRERIRASILAADRGDGGSLLTALLLGETQYLSTEVLTAFRQTGVAHILSISGLHVSLVALFFYLCFRWAGSLPPLAHSIRWLRFTPLLVILPVWAYVATANFPVSAVRAGIMASLFLVALSIWRKIDLLSVWALAAFLILVFEPLALFQAGFQLSFMAVLFLILFLPGRHHWLFNLAAVSFWALLGVGALLLYHFNNVSLFGVLANVVILPLVNLVLMPLAMLGWLLSGLFGFSLGYLWAAAVWAAGLVIKINGLLAGRAEHFIYYGSIVFWQLALYYGAFLLLAWRPLTWRRRLAFFIPMMALVLWGGKMPYDGKLRVTFVDVGQGDCAVVQIPNGKVWVIDGGGIRSSDWDVGRFIVAPYLWSQGIRRVDRLFLSHPHHDHFKGLGYLAERFAPRVIYTNGDQAPEPELEEWQEFLKKLGSMKMEKVTRKTKPIEEAGVRVEFLMPGPKGTIPHFNFNDNSMAFRLDYKEVSFLFPGDLMEAGEMVLMESKPNLKADVLKIAHHGSGTSTTPAFLAAVQPKHAVISVGEYNSYGMPDDAVIRRLEQGGAQVYRTDRHGAVAAVTDGKTIEVKTFVKK